MILQLHHQLQDGSYEFRAQSAVFKDAMKPQAFLDAMWSWVWDVKSRHPLPDGAQWVMCNQDAEMFMRAAKT